MLYPDQTQLSLALIKNGEVEFLGMKKEKKSIVNLENHQSVFEIGSITKVFTATILANFVLDERVGLDDKINDYLDFDLRKGVRLSFKELANHTSGLPSIPLSIVLTTKTNPYKLFDNAKLQEYFMKKMKLSRNRGKNISTQTWGQDFSGMYYAILPGRVTKIC
jgi:CubicO group peptidase (beta-lactamase class C family)